VSDVDLPFRSGALSGERGVIARGAGVGSPQVRVNTVRAAMAPAAAAFYGDPTARLSTVGVTGTNGKTTTAFLVRELLEADGRPAGLLGTVKSVIGGVEHEVQRTTPEAIDLQRTFRRMLDEGDRACAMEVSSHALELKRADRRASTRHFETVDAGRRSMPAGMCLMPLRDR